MKLPHMIPPVLALVICAAWLTSLRNTNRTLQQENAMLRDTITNSPKPCDSQIERTIANEKSGKKAAGNEINPSPEWVLTSKDWNRIVLYMNDESPYSKEGLIRLKQLAVGMTGDQLASAYTQMASLAVLPQILERIQDLMLDELDKKNPEFAFDQYIAKYHITEKFHPGINGFDDWLARDPTTATAWYDQHIASGNLDKSLDGKSRLILPFESAFIRSFMSKNPAEAERRMNAIPPEQREALFWNLHDLAAKDRIAIDELLRKTMPMEK